MKGPGSTAALSPTAPPPVSPICGLLKARFRLPPEFAEVKLGFLDSFSILGSKSFLRAQIKNKG